MSGALGNWRPPAGRPAGQAYMVAVGAVGAAVILNLVLWRIIQPSATPIFFAAVAVSSWYGGQRPGLLATALAAVITEVWFVPPWYELNVGTLVRVASFSVVALLVASLYERARVAQVQAQGLAEDRQAALVQEQSARAEAETASRAKDEFLATLSHELRTPLNALMGWVWWLRRGDLDAARTARALETLDRNTKSLAQLIEDLLDMSRITTGKLRLDLGGVELPQLIEAAIEAVRPAATAKGLELDVVLDHAAGTVNGDADRLQQVMWNLLSNAVKFTPDRGRVTVRLERMGAVARIVVQDTGRGIEPAALPYIFDRFRQAEGAARRQQGLGLGLSIVRHLVEIHGGSIHASSQGEGQGATFTVTLPMAPLNGQPSVPAASVVAAPPPRERVLDGLHVLVVEDSPDDREWLSKALEAFGARVTPATTVREAMAVLGRDAVDVVVSDVRLPGEDGYDLIRQVRADDMARGRKTAAVAITAYARVEDRERALVAGYQMHVPKPVDPTELASVVASVVGRVVQPSA